MCSVAGMLLHINWKITMIKLESWPSFHDKSYDFNYITVRSRCGSRYAANLARFVVQCMCYFKKEGKAEFLAWKPNIFKWPVLFVNEFWKVVPHFPVLSWCLYHTFQSIYKAPLPHFPVHLNSLPPPLSGSYNKTSSPTLSDPLLCLCHRNAYCLWNHTWQSTPKPLWYCQMYSVRELLPIQYGLFLRISF